MPFHGMLSNKGKLNLVRTPAVGEGKLFEKNAHPDQDAFPAVLPDPLCTRLSGVAMTMPYTIIVGKPGVENLVSDIVAEVFDHADGFLNCWNPESEISVLNRIKPGKNAPLSSDLSKLLTIVDEAHELTDGRFDPTTGVLTVAFENCIAENGRPPLPSEIAPFKHAIGWKKRITRGKGNISRNNAHTVVDLDGVAKGHVIDMIVEELLRQGFVDCYVDWAGDIRSAGSHPSGRPWRSAVMRPPELQRVFSHWKKGTVKQMLREDDIGYFADFLFRMGGEDVASGAIATSGDYFSVQKYGYHHIARADTLTVMKANSSSVGTVCVAARTCALADALATAAMTADDVDSAIALLKNVVKSRADAVYGFCVLSRKEERDSNQLHYTDSIFRPVLAEGETSPSSSIKSNEVAKEVATSNTNAIRRNTIGTRYQYSYMGHTLELDNFVACSMEPEQIVTIMVPKGFVEQTASSKEGQSNGFECKILSPLSQEELSKSRDTGLKVTLAFRQISYLDESALISAAIETVTLDATEGIQAVFNGAFIQKKELQLGVPRAKIPLLPLVEQAKILFRQIPSTVWVVTTTSADGNQVALTATSVVAPASSPGVFCFNVANSSAFFASIGGMGSKIQAYALSTRQKQLAEFYVKNSVLQGEKSLKLKSDAMISVDCTVDHVDNFQDHLVVLARITDTKPCIEDGAEPLVWQNGTFLN